MASFPAAYLGLAIFARFNIGERHILPLYPFALVFAALVWERAGQRRAGLAVLSLLAALNCADALRYAPGYLSYFNVFVWPDTREQAESAATRQGYHVVLEKHAGMAYSVVSDLNQDELAAFARMLIAPSLPPR